METKLDVQKAITHLQKKWGNNSCPMCGKRQWKIADKIYELREFHKESKSYPISIEEWKFLKDKINKITIKQNWYHNVSFTLIGGHYLF